MAESKPVTIRIPEPWLSRIEALAAEKYPGRKGNPNKSQVVLDAIDFYLQHLYDSKDSVGNNDGVLNVTNISIQETVNLAVKQQIEQLTIQLKQALNQCLTSLTKAQPQQIETILETCLTVPQQKPKDLGQPIVSKSPPSPRKTTPKTAPLDKQELNEQKLTRHEMYKYLGISPRTLDIWIKKAKNFSEPPIISYQGQSWRYILSGEGVKKIFVLIEE
jgi:hypothetical protein